MFLLLLVPAYLKRLREAVADLCFLCLHGPLFIAWSIIALASWTVSDFRGLLIHSYFWSKMENSVAAEDTDIYLRY